LYFANVIEMCTAKSLVDVIVTSAEGCSASRVNNYHPEKKSCCI